MPDRRTSNSILILVSVMTAALLWLLGPIPQDPNYHQFADSRQIAGVANFWNVISNIPFLIAGLIGFWRYPRLTHSESKFGYLLLCASVFLVGFGSAYYHDAPSNASLLWDRLPMSIGFMALLSLLLGERVITTHKMASLCLLILIGIAAPLYWFWSESTGKGDLRPYVLVQFLPIILTPLILLLYRARYFSNRLLLYAFGWYFAAKLLEHFDLQIWYFTSAVSGHTIKHLAATAAVLCLIYALPANATRR